MDHLRVQLGAIRVFRHRYGNNKNTADGIDRIGITGKQIRCVYDPRCGVRTNIENC